MRLSVVCAVSFISLVEFWSYFSQEETEPGSDLARLRSEPKTEGGGGPVREPLSPVSTHPSPGHSPNT